MSATTEIHCETCGADLTYTGNSVDHRLVLANQSKTPWYVGEGFTSGAVTDMSIEPPLSRTLHFCDLNCLQEWASRPPIEK